MLEWIREINVSVKYTKNEWQFLKITIVPVLTIVNKNSVKKIKKDSREKQCKHASNN